MIQPVRSNSTSFLFRVAAVTAVFGLITIPASEVEAQDANDKANRLGFIIEVPLPLTLDRAAAVKQTVRNLLDNTPIINEQLPVFVMQFATARGETGEGSDFNACAALAEFLASPEMSRIKAVAYVPPIRRPIAGAPDAKLVGHAVLVALACEEIVLHETASFGEASIDTPDVTPPMRSTYQFIAGKRSPIPEPVTLSLLERSRTLYEVPSLNGDLYLEFEAADKMVREGKTSIINELVNANNLGLFDAETLESFSTNCHVVETRAQLADLYQIPPSALEGAPTRGTRNRAIQLQLPNFIDQQSVDWSTRALDAKIGDDTNMIILRFNADGGDLQACLQMARYLADFDSSEIMTVGYIEGEATGPAAIIALTCDRLMMQPKARLGGRYEPAISKEELEVNRAAIEDLAAEKEKSWSLFLSVLDYNTELQRWKHKSSRTQLFSKEEHEQMSDADLWTWLDIQPMQDGLSGDNAWQQDVASNVFQDFQKLEAYYNLEDTEVLTPTRTDKMIESLAEFLATPFISSMLLFGAMFLISTEMSNPGISIPGFLGALCLILFFWSQYLDGNAHWLEILLFIAGAMFILMEIFVIPGIGVFGIGGLVMVVTSIVLASQTFIIPKNSEEFARLPVSLGMVAAASAGFLVALTVLRKVLPNTPYFKKMMLEPPAQDQPGQHDRETIVDWSEMQGKSGVAITPLIPAGKARIAGQLLDVISDGRVIEKGEPIFVQEAVGNRVVVVPKNNDASSG